MAKPFTFVLAQTHPEFKRKDQAGWWLKVAPTDAEKAKVIAEVAPTRVHIGLYEKQLAQGHTLLINGAGGYCYLDPEVVTVLMTVDRARLDWPYSQTY